ncbi:PepSY domain-containing protein [Streptomyces sp. LP05-1]|uniref:PepSY domain-containing protein n=1 Tax=Streptomyces pyxinae TaxID=2970734 RepID=A0ABT2CAM1_9ACTN|nr:PepSY domain-containing protein [Streptomyces sp. LP05-1]MCS0634450.1 PepSY domain-containing protein [Streptomyces sp. LP05-1]
MTSRSLRLRAVTAVCAALGSTLLLSACGTDGGDSDQVRAAAPTPSMSSHHSPSEGASASPGTSSASPGGGMTEDQADRKALVPAAKVTWDKAAATAVGEVPQGKLTDIELTRYEGGASASPAPSPGTPEWAAKVAAPDGTLHRVRVNAVDGKVIESRAESDQDADDKKQVTDWLGKAKWTPQQAAKAATDRKQGTVTAIELDDKDDRTVVWKVDVVTTNDWNKTSYDVNASDGAIVREHVDTD